jgi:hypothetical protein
MRAVSSPSLTESPFELPATSTTTPKFSAKPEPIGHAPSHLELNERGHQQGGMYCVVHISNIGIDVIAQ